MRVKRVATCCELGVTRGVTSSCCELLRVTLPHFCYYCFIVTCLLQHLSVVLYPDCGHTLTSHLQWLSVFSVSWIDDQGLVGHRSQSFAGNGNVTHRECTVYLQVTAFTHGGLSFPLLLPFHCGKFANVVKQIDHAHQQEMLKHVI